jgi:catechol 1,2-dioxygenase
VLAACSGDGPEASAPVTSPSTSTSRAADCRPTSGGEAQGNPTATATTPSFVKLGPGPDITPEEAAAEAPARRGTPLVISGTVYAADCRTPLAGAVIEAWQTDARGVYGPGQAADELRCCYLQGTVQTDSAGRYRIQTIRPGHYRGEDPPPPAHIHLNVSHEDGGVLTEVTFADDPYVSDAAEAVRLRKQGEQLIGRFDIVLAEAG